MPGITTGTVTLPFRDRAHAGQALAGLLAPVIGEAPCDVVVLALPRGGVPVAREVATALDAPLDVLVVRKLGMPSRPELALGAVASTAGSAEPVRVLNEALLTAGGLADGELAPARLHEVTERELAELRRREIAYRGDRPALDVAGKTVIVVDDGLATGASARAALLALQRQRPARMVLAVPVAPRSALAGLVGVADEVVCAATPRRFVAVGRHYVNFNQVTDAEVRRLLAGAE